MTKYIWSKDKERNKWPDEIYEKLIDKSLKPRDFKTTDKLNCECEIHGTFTRGIGKIYMVLNNNGELCPKCSKLLGYKKAEKTNLEKYGTKAPAQNKEVLEKMKKSNLEKYGVEFQVQAEDFEEKRNATNLEKYGVEHVLQNKEVKAKANKVMLEKYGTVHALQNKDSHNKFKDTMNERYGVDYALQNEELRDRFTESMVDKYGVEHALQNEDLLTKMGETNLEKFGVDRPTKSYEVYLKICETKNQTPIKQEMFDILNNEEKFSNYIDKITKELGSKPMIFELTKRMGYDRNISISRKILDYGLQDKIKYMAGESQYEYELMDFLKRFNIKCEHRYTKLGPELDIYLADYDIGIELNGLYWHSDEFKKKKYHYNKYKHYKDIGTRVINIYEDEWANEEQQEIIKSIILSACNISTNKTVEYARKLKIVEITKGSNLVDKVRDFYDENHLQGHRSSSVYIALVDTDDDIIECMSFGHAYFGNRGDRHKYQYELIRHCTKMYHNVVGGKERIFKYFLNNYPYDKKYQNYIVTYCDIDKFNGNSYEKLGFKYINHSIQMWGIVDLYSARIYRNPSNNDYFKDLPKIYGCGNNTYSYNISKKGGEYL